MRSIIGGYIREMGKGLITTILLAITLVSCTPQPERVVKTSWSETQEKSVAYELEKDGKTIVVKEEQFYEDGTLEYTGEFDDNGERHGLWKYYYPNSQLWSTGTYDHGKMTGKKQVYWEDGTLRYEGQFKNDVKTGTWTFYNADGSVLQTKDF